MTKALGSRLTAKDPRVMACNAAYRQNRLVDEEAEALRLRQAEEED
jgi:hypothetical protein